MSFTREEENRLHEKALETWGLISQLDMLIEECSELILAIQHLRRANKGGGWDEVYEEIADVENMIAQFKRQDPLLIETIRQRKLGKLADLLGAT